MKPRNLILTSILIICVGLAPKAHAISPPPDGGYPGGNTAEGQDRKIVKQEATITQLKKDMDALVACLKEHDSKIQRVTDQIEMSSSASQMVVND